MSNAVHVDATKLTQELNAAHREYLTITEVPQVTIDQPQAEPFAACYTVILGNRPGERIGLVKLNETGYYPCRGYDYAPDSLDTVRERVAELNAKLGIPEDVAESMTYGSLFGWGVPAAARAIAYYAVKGAEETAAGR